MKISINDSFLAFVKHKIANPADRTRGQDEEELITLDDQEVENITELTFLDSKDLKTVTGLRP